MSEQLCKTEGDPMITETIENKIRNAGKTSKYHLRKKDEEKGYYIQHKDLKIPYAAMFFKSTNRKLKKITSISADSSLNCISKKLNQCQLPSDVSCYGCDSETQYCRKDIINCQDANIISGYILENCNPEKMIEYMKEKYDNEIIRFNKHGDFRNKKQLHNFLHIATHTPNILYYGYTARDDLLNKLGMDSLFWMKQKNIILNGSNQKYTNHYKGVYEYTGKHPKCQGDCTICGNCYTLRNKTIEVKYH